MTRSASSQNHARYAELPNKGRTARQSPEKTDGVVTSAGGDTVRPCCLPGAAPYPAVHTGSADGGMRCSSLREKGVWRRKKGWRANSREAEAEWGCDWQGRWASQEEGQQEGAGDGVGGGGTLAANAVPSAMLEVPGAAEVAGKLGGKHPSARHACFRKLLMGRGVC